MYDASRRIYQKRNPRSLRKAVFSVLVGFGLLLSGVTLLIDSNPERDALDLIGGDLLGEGADTPTIKVTSCTEVKNNVNQYIGKKVECSFEEWYGEESKSLLFTTVNVKSGNYKLPLLIENHTKVPVGIGQSGSVVATIDRNGMFGVHQIKAESDYIPTNTVTPDSADRLPYDANQLQYYCAEMQGSGKVSVHTQINHGVINATVTEDTRGRNLSSLFNVNREVILSVLGDTVIEIKNTVHKENPKCLYQEDSVVTTYVNGKYCAVDINGLNPNDCVNVKQ